MQKKTFSSVKFGHMNLFGLSSCFRYWALNGCFLFILCPSCHIIPQKVFLKIILSRENCSMWLLWSVGLSVDLFSICVKRVLNVSPSAVALGAPVSSSSAFCSTNSVRARLVPLALSELAHHLMVLVAQNTGQEEGSFVRAPCLKAPPGPALPVDGHVPLPFRTGTTLAAPCPGPCWWRLGCSMVPWCVGVVA